MTDYFRAELMSRLPGDEARFLKHTSVLERMCGGLCDSVVESTGSADVLERLERANHFVVPLDRRGEWYRYHHLFAELLRNELARTEPDVAAELNRRAMTWCVAHDLPEAALIYGHAAGETDTVAGLVDALALPTHYDGRMETLDGWLRMVQRGRSEALPRARREGAWLRALTGRSAEAERWLALAEGATSTIPLSDGSATIEPWVAVLRAGDDAGRPRAGRCRRRSGGRASSLRGAPWRPAALTLRGTAHVRARRRRERRSPISAADGRARLGQATQPVTVAHAQLALLAAQARSLERGRGAGVGAAEGWSRTRASAITRPALSSTWRRRASRCTRGARRMPVQRMTGAHRLRPLLDYGPSVADRAGRARARLARTWRSPNPARPARFSARPSEVLERPSDMGILVEDARELHDRVAATSGPDGAWAMSLTGAELRLLPYLATHLTFPEIASRLFISRNTVKSQAVSIYRKLGVSSRNDAIERAVEVGLLDDSVYPRPFESHPGWMMRGSGRRGIWATRWTTTEAPPSPRRT